ncbi:class I SAM-dependent methyltransferase [Paenibacillus harenae]|uniref:class I SAM-dependent methyltransferase n=1 Tax=Paenibacillus harenae TaxID=306543 RepID=UPI0027933DE2|nr:class I SAM-dependent methyltransferase [Paenibacillus harenae]MDQ0060084.1 2-polyprenyl-3-methyl-5-hydroxy-6-metoxy-1,4-benzoquinol methylase [Paenibacillus harenae]
MNRVERIRDVEKKYHDACYEEHKLFEPGSWLHKPVATVLEVLEQFKEYRELNVLDLGAGIGRNSIPIAQTLIGRAGKVVCVDLLESAIAGLLENSKQFGVESYIDARLSDIEHFTIVPSEYDYIIAVSSLEHVSSEAILARKLGEMVRGTKPGGFHCIIIGSNIQETTQHGNMKLDPMFEVNISTESMLALLDEQYAGWDVQRRHVKPLAYEIDRNGEPVKLTTDCITFVAKR